MWCSRDSPWGTKTLRGVVSGGGMVVVWSCLGGLVGGLGFGGREIALSDDNAWVESVGLARSMRSSVWESWRAFEGVSGFRSETAWFEVFEVVASMLTGAFALSVHADEAFSFSSCDGKGKSGFAVMRFFSSSLSTSESLSDDSLALPELDLLCFNHSSGFTTGPAVGIVL